MTISKLLSTIGILLIVWAIVSGLNLHYSFSNSGSDFSSGYTFKFGSLLIGIALIFIGKKLGK